MRRTIVSVLMLLVTATAAYGAVDPNERFVVQTYLDLLRRDPSVAEKNSGVATLAGNPGSVGRTTLVQQLTSSSEYRQSIITDAYQRYLHRSSSGSDVTFWQGQFSGGGTVEQFVAAILGSLEYFNNGGGANLPWIDHVFADLLGRSPSASEENFYSTMLASMTRTNVAAQILDTTERRTAFIAKLYDTILRRAPSGPDTTFFVNQMQGGATDEQVIAAIAISNEFFTKASGPAGDGNGDGSFSVLDTLFALRSLFGGGTQPFAIGDVNGDGHYNVSDVFYSLNALYNGGQPPQ